MATKKPIKQPTKQPTFPESKTEMTFIAQMMRGYYNLLTAQGFNNEEAMEFVKAYHWALVNMIVAQVQVNGMPEELKHNSKIKNPMIG